ALFFRRRPDSDDSRVWFDRQPGFVSRRVRARDDSRKGRATMRIGFVGLGGMGSGIARNLVRAGHEVIVHNRTAAKAEDLAREGAVAARALTELAGVEVAFTMLADDPAVEQIALGEGGLRDVLGAGAVHVSMSTIGVALARRLEDAHRAAGQTLVSAPVFGRPEAAAAAKLFVVAAGPDPALARVRELFAAIGQRTFELGDDPVAANVVKLGGNFLLAAAIEAIGEAAALVRKNGVDPARFVEVLTGTLFACRAYEGYGAMIAQQRFEPAGFQLGLGLKDVRLVLAAGDASSTPL